MNLNRLTVGVVLIKPQRCIPGFLNRFNFIRFPSLVLDTEVEEEMEETCEENLKTLTETSPPPTGPSGLVIFGLLVQKHSYVSALIIMMVNYTLSLGQISKKENLFRCMCSVVL